jgi:hypothetical protein
MEDVVACMRQHRRSAAAQGKRQGRDRVEKVLDLDRARCSVCLFFFLRDTLRVVGTGQGWVRRTDASRPFDRCLWTVEI